MPMLPSLSTRLKWALRSFMANENLVKRQIPISTPDFAVYIDELLENTVVKLMEEIEKGPGG